MLLKVVRCGREYLQRNYSAIQSIEKKNITRSVSSSFNKKGLHELPAQQNIQKHTLATQVHSIHLKMSAGKPKIVFVLGGPGAGKGTQCSKLVERFQFVHLSAGDLLREERAREGSEFGTLIEDYIRNGKIVPVEVTCSLLEAAMNKSGKDKFLIDGFPRNQDNLDGWNRQMSDKVDFKFVLFFNCSEDICVQRCLGRGQTGSGRSDDNMDSLKKRIQTYNNDSLPIIKYFEDLGKVKQIDASPNAEQVFKKVEEIFIDSGFE